MKRYRQAQEPPHPHLSLVHECGDIFTASRRFSESMALLRAHQLLCPEPPRAVTFYSCCQSQTHSLHMVSFFQPNLTKKLQKLLYYPPMCRSQQQLSVKEADVAPTKPSSGSDVWQQLQAKRSPNFSVHPRVSHNHRAPGSYSIPTSRHWKKSRKEGYFQVGLSPYTVQACRCARDGAATERSFCKPCFRAPGNETLLSVQPAGCKKWLPKNRARRRGPEGRMNSDLAGSSRPDVRQHWECLLALLTGSPPPDKQQLITVATIPFC